MLPVCRELLDDLWRCRMVFLVNEVSMPFCTRFSRLVVNSPLQLVHAGYGFAIGNVAATDIDNPECIFYLCMDLVLNLIAGLCGRNVHTIFLFFNSCGQSRGGGI